MDSTWKWDRGVGLSGVVTAIWRVNELSMSFSFTVSASLTKDPFDNIVKGLFAAMFASGAFAAVNLTMIWKDCSDASFYAHAIDVQPT